VINERIYEQESEEVAREVCARLLQKEWTGNGVEAVLAQAASEFRAEYRQRIAHRAIEVNERFDALTGHGKNDEPKVIDAIEQAFQDSRTSPATKAGDSQRSQRDKDRKEDS
jgi:hypothetical protein